MMFWKRPGGLLAWIVEAVLVTLAVRLVRQLVRWFFRRR